MPFPKVAAQALPEECGVCGQLLKQNVGREIQALSYSSTLGKFHRVLKIAAQQRLRTKVEKLKSELAVDDHPSLEQKLFRLTAEGFGLTAARDQFVEIAETIPYHCIHQALRMGDFDKLLVQGLWLLGAIDPAGLCTSTFLPPYEANRLQAIFLKEKARITQRPRLQRVLQPSLVPPAKRWVGLGQLLHATARKGLLRHFWQLLRTKEPLQHLYQSANPAGSLPTKIEQSFAENPLLAEDQNFYGLKPTTAQPLELRKKIQTLFLPQKNSKAAKAEESWLDLPCTGEDRMGVVLVNAILPFFLAWAEKIEDEALAKGVFQLYWSFPGEKKANHKVRVMEERLGFPPISKSFKKSLAYHQAMLHCSKELCLTFEQGCKSCPLPQWLK